MKRDKLFLKRISLELLSELGHISRLMDEYRDFINKYSGGIDRYLLRVKESFELEKIFEKTWKRFSMEIKKFCCFLEGKAG